MKEKIKNWFLSDREFETGKQLFMKYGTNLSFKNMLNRGGHSPDNYKFLCYELAKIAEIPEPVYKQMLKTPLVNQKPDKNELTNVDINLLPIDRLADQIEIVDISELKWPVIQKLVKHLKLNPVGKKKADFISALEEAKKQKFVSIVPDNVKRSIKLREEFPFLKQKDCPDVLKVLVNDMLTAYDEFVSGHEKLLEATTEEEIKSLTETVVENYLDNREIWEELNHYKQKGETLGKHPVFAWMKRKAEIEAMKEADLVILRDQLKNKIPRTKKKIEDEPEHKETAKRLERVAQFEKELELVNKLLGIDG